MAMSPDRETAPYVGLRPTTPQNDAGSRIEPNVSDPSDPSAIFAATAAADPPDDPPGTRVASWGFLVTLNAEFSVEEPIANSSIFVFPRNMAWCDLNFSITPAS